MSKAADLANLIGNINAGGGGVNRNLIINGAMNVAQRGTVTGVGNDAYTLDRFAFTYSQDGAFTVTQDSSAPDGFANSLKVDVTTADDSLATSQYLIMEHKIEAQNLQHLHFGKSSAKNIALSFYVKSNKTGTYGVSIIQSDNSSKIANLTYTINSANTWEQKSLTFTGDTSGVINDDNGIGLKVGFTLAVGSTWTSGDTSASFRTFVNGNYGAGQTVNILDHVDNEWFITGVQLEVGQNPTEFEHEKFSQTLEKCSRYYQKTKADSDSYKHFGLWFCAADTGGGGTGYGTVAIPLVTTMRTIPSLETTGTVGNYSILAKNVNYALTTFSVDTGIDDGTINGQFYLNAYSAGGMGVGTAGAVRANNTSVAFVALDAEL